MEHGGDIETYRGAYPHPLIDFSANINPLGLDERLKKAMIEALESGDRYPDRHYRHLKAQLARFLRVEPETVVVGNGAMEIIAICISLFQRIYLAEPCFNEYARIASDRGIEIVRHKMAPPFQLDVAAFIEAMPTGSLTILTNPNNPTGYLLSPEELDRIYHAVKEREGYLLLDETFIDLVDPEGADRFYGRERERLIKVQAATKSLALAGIRLGFGVIHEPLKGRFLARQLPWTVNAFAEACGRQINEMASYLEASRQLIASERSRLLDVINGSTIGEATRGEANFLLIHLEASVRDRCFDFLLSRGILVRTYGASGRNYIRIAVRRPEENERFIRAWRELERRASDV